MGRPIKIRSPRIAGAKVHSPQARYTAVPKISIKIPPQAGFSYRYGLPRTQPKITLGTFGTTPTQGLTGQARLFGKPKDLMQGSHFTKSLVGLTAAAGALTFVLENPTILSGLANEIGSYGQFLGLTLFPVLGMVIGRGGKAGKDGSVEVDHELKDKVKEEVRELLIKEVGKRGVRRNSPTSWEPDIVFANFNFDFATGKVEVVSKGRPGLPIVYIMGTRQVYIYPNILIWIMKRVAEADIPIPQRSILLAIQELSGEDLF